MTADARAAGLDRVRELVARDAGLALVATTRADGSVQASVVNAGVLDHWAPLDDVMAAERHTGVLVRPARIYPGSGA